MIACTYLTYLHISIVHMKKLALDSASRFQRVAGVAVAFSCTAVHVYVRACHLPLEFLTASYRT